MLVVRLFCRLVCLLLCGVSCQAQEKREDPPIQSEQYTLVFAGDIMVHGPQIKAALRPQGRYDFSSSFDSVARLISQADVAIGNLETTFSGKPFTGYPMFSSPDAMGEALRAAGFDILTTSNNHSADRAGRGIVRTLDVLDSLGILTTGTYRNINERPSRVPLIYQLGNIRLAVMAYTYGTNGLAVPKPTVVDLIDTALMARDIRRADSLGAEYKIVQIHWGAEYQKHPNEQQQGIARWLHRQGVDAIIGSHPHVVQRSEFLSDSTLRPTFVIYSLGNFVSNQRTPAATRGGLLLSLHISRENPEAPIVTKPEYQWLFVNKYTPSGDGVFRLLPVDIFSSEMPRDLPPSEAKDYQAYRDYYRTIPMVYQNNVIHND